MDIKAFKQVLKLVQKSEKAKHPRFKFFRYSTWFKADQKHKTVKDVVDHPCGTAGCLGGWGTLLELAKTKAGLDMTLNPWGSCSLPNGCNSSDFAAQFYDINSADAEYLFYGHWHKVFYFAPTADVITKLKNIIETGKVENPEFDAQFLAHAK